MCRHLAYLGPPRPMAALVLDPSHSLLHQSYAPQDMRGGGTVNADGFGLGWYSRGDGVARTYRRSCPVWADPSLESVARDIVSGCFVAAVRNATTGMPVVETAAAPFSDNGWLFSHNGFVPGWPDSMVSLAAALPTSDLLSLPAATDSALLWALVRARLHKGQAPADALVEVVLDVIDVAPAARLNLLLTDGSSIAATTWTHALWVSDGADQVIVSSEPLESHDEAWHEIPDHHLLLARPGAVQIRPIPDSTDGPRAATTEEAT